MRRSARKLRKGAAVQREQQLHHGGSLTRASAEYRSVYGTVKSGWEKTGGGCVFRIEIPANTTAALRLPNGETRTLCAGSYVFETC